MQWMRRLGIVSALGVIVCCFFPWLVWQGHGMSVSGIDARLIRWGRPGYGHFLFCLLFLLFHIGHRVALRLLAVAMAALNFAWAVRDIYIGLGNRGEDIRMQPALYTLVVLSTVMLIAILAAPETTAASVMKEQGTMTPIEQTKVSEGDL